MVVCFDFKVVIELNFVIKLPFDLSYYQDLPLGLMDDIYDWLGKYGQRIDELEEVRSNGMRNFQL